MKKFLFIVGIIVLAGGIFIGGLVAGSVLDFMIASFSVSTFDQALVDANMEFMTISILDEKGVEEAKGFMNMELATHIMTLDMFMEDCPNAESKEQGQKFLARVAEHRLKYPVSKDEDMAGVQNHIQEILGRALENRKTTEPVK